MCWVPRSWVCSIEKITNSDDNWCYRTPLTYARRNKFLRCLLVWSIYIVFLTMDLVEHGDCICDCVLLATGKQPSFAPFLCVRLVNWTANCLFENRGPTLFKNQLLGARCCGENSSKSFMYWFVFRNLIFPDRYFVAFHKRSLRYPPALILAYHCAMSFHLCRTPNFLDFSDQHYKLPYPHCAFQRFILILPLNSNDTKKGIRSFEIMKNWLIVWSAGPISRISRAAMWLLKL